MKLEAIVLGGYDKLRVKHGSRTNVSSINWDNIITGIGRKRCTPHGVGYRKRTVIYHYVVDV